MFVVLLCGSGAAGPKVRPESSPNMRIAWCFRWFRVLGFKGLKALGFKG